MDKLLKIFGLLGIIIVSFSIFYYFVIIPYQKKNREKYCIDKIGIDYHKRSYDSKSESFRFCLLDND